MLKICQCFSYRELGISLDQAVQEHIRGCSYFKGGGGGTRIGNVGAVSLRQF